MHQERLTSQQGVAESVGRRDKMYSGIKSALSEEAGCIEYSSTESIPLLVALNDSSHLLPINSRDGLGGNTSVCHSSIRIITPFLMVPLPSNHFTSVLERRNVLKDTSGTLVTPTDITFLFLFYLFQIIQPVVSIAKDKLLVIDFLYIFP